MINRQDVLKSMQLLGRQPQIGETVNDQIAKHISIHQQGINVDVSPLITNHYGTLSKAVFVGVLRKRFGTEMKESIKR